MIRYHPSICQVNIVHELDCQHLGIYLDNRPNQPITNTDVVPVVIAVDFYVISNFV